ncbi:hypothetical protein F528_2424 [Neisseria meningitidis 992008]|uniref:Uncharacterized protein n=1 Tax=Neisseria meningitidis TaxID=487 RepID=X5F5V9_NEIME|nr:hypothetical protein NMA510612_0246 [Neisseria meningitidis]KER38607.1 hypothetical protein F528_2424 [Neisseria meningitidis 992008]
MLNHIFTRFGWHKRMMCLLKNLCLPLKKPHFTEKRGLV